MFYLIIKFVTLVESSPVVGVHHMCQQRYGEDPASGLPQPPTAQPPLQRSVCAAQAQACQHTHRSIALQPEALNLQGSRARDVFR